MMSELNSPQDSSQNGHAPAPKALLERAEAADANVEIELLHAENAALRAKVEDLEQMFATASKEAEERWADRQREYESLLEEKSEVIRSLHQKIADMRERAASVDTAPPAEGDEDIPDRQELLRLKRDLDEQRRQMEEDEESMMAQLRQMEMSLAKDRADLARQRAEIQRLHEELKHELEAASRDGGLRERLGALQRRAGSSSVARSNVNQDTSGPNQMSKVPPGATKSGLFRRIFGSGQ